MSWTDERVERLKTLWSEGLSASQIATELGAVTRNAVIGKVHRLGLSGRAKPQVQPARPQAAAPQRVKAAPSRTVAQSSNARVIAHPPGTETLAEVGVQIEHVGILPGAGAPR